MSFFFDDPPPECPVCGVPHTCCVSPGYVPPQAATPGATSFTTKTYRREPPTVPSTPVVVAPSLPTTPRRPRRPSDRA
jgi:hypothetical protein